MVPTGSGLMRMNGGDSPARTDASGPVPALLQLSTACALSQEEATGRVGQKEGTRQHQSCWKAKLRSPRRLRAGQATELPLTRHKTLITHTCELGTNR